MLPVTVQLKNIIILTPNQEIGKLGKQLESINQSNNK